MPQLRPWRAGPLNPKFPSTPRQTPQPWPKFCKPLLQPHQVVARVANLCPECAYGALDLSIEAFVLVGEKQDGIIPISWSVVTCTEELVQGPIEMMWKSGASQYSVELQVGSTIKY